MKTQQRWPWMLCLGLAAAAVGLAGCPKSPDVAETRPPGPTTAAPATPGPGAAPRVTPPETRVAPPPVVREGTTAPGAAGAGTGAPGGARAGTPGAGAGGASPLKPVYFDYDKATLTDEAKRILNENAVWLKTNAQARVVIEGHCDERGSSEYNLALGDRRAKAVRDYLLAAGVDGSRLRTISYGKERPVDPGHDERAWRLNRRAQFTLAP